MRQIKFRGRVLDSNKQDGGKTVYGMLSICTLKDKTHWIYPLDGGWGWEVDPDSVAQLIGYDSNGVEVYEGDILFDAYGNQYEVQFYPMGVNDDDCINLADSAKLNLTLKEEQS